MRDGFELDFLQDLSFMARLAVALGIIIKEIDHHDKIRCATAFSAGVGFASVSRLQ